jgi:CRP-like cAMP-binding protein
MVMLVEVPDPGVVLGILASFVIGLASVVAYNKIRPHLSSDANNVKILVERLQHYESLLIDMKIKLDSLESATENEEPPHVEISKPKQQKPQMEVPIEVKEEKPKERVHNMNFGSATEYVLRLITEKTMTSHDIQITIGRTREHTSRMMKKLFEEGLVERNMQTKPFTYKITEKGLARIGAISAPTVQ